MKLLINSHNRIYLILIVVSIAAASIVTFLLNRSMNPYRLEVLQHNQLKAKSQSGLDYIIYHDFDRDGVSESMLGRNDGTRPVYYLWVANSTGGVVDQCNYSESTHFDQRKQWLLFEDYNKDGFDEIFAFTQESDSLFLYIHDLRRKQPILNRHYLLQARYGIVGGGFIDIENQKGRGLVFASCFDQQRRGVYIFDIKKRKIVKRFESEAYPGNLLQYDLTGDGKQEIILTCWAIGSVHYPAQYTDQKNWLFVFNQQLSPIFEPLSFGEFSSSLTCLPIEIDKERLLLLSYSYVGEKNLRDFICLINSSGKISPKKYFSEGLIVNHYTNPPALYAASKHGDIIKMNNQLNIILKTPTWLKKVSYVDSISPSHLVDLNGDGGLELICTSNKNIQIFDEQLKLLASFPVPSKEGTITFRETGEGNPLELGLNSGEDFYRFAFKKNALFQAWPLSWLGFSVLTFLLLAGGYKSSALVYTYLSFFRFSLSRTANGVLILNSTGQISFLNQRVQMLLDLKNPISKGQHFTEAFEEKPQLRAWIRKAMDSGTPVKEKMSVIQPNHQFEGEIRVTPFLSSFKLISAYLVEIQDYTQPIISERLQMWSKSVQKIAHDIKTPLSSVALNLKALQMRLENISLPKREQVNDDIEMMRTELQRVHNMTKSFLKFTDLEKPHFQVVSAREIIQNAMNQFSSFPNGDIQIQSDLESDLDDLWADPQQIELVFHIVLENAVDALQGKGLIKISSSLAQYLDKSFQRFLEVEVSDTGPGIDPKSRDKIFEPYFTTKTNGTGMGLAIARKIIEDHGGVIGLHTHPGLGTVIRFSLPLYEDNSSSES